MLSTVGRLMDPGDVVGSPEASCGLPLPLANGLPAVWVWYDMVQYGIFWYCMVWISMIPYQIRSVSVAITLPRPLANGLARSACSGKGTISKNTQLH